MSFDDSIVLFLKSLHRRRNKRQGELNFKRAQNRVLTSNPVSGLNYFVLLIE